MILGPFDLGVQGGPTIQGDSGPTDLVANLALSIRFDWSKVRTICLDLSRIVM